MFGRQIAVQFVLFPPKFRQLLLKALILLDGPGPGPRQLLLGDERRVQLLAPDGLGALALGGELLEFGFGPFRLGRVLAQLALEFLGPANRFRGFLLFRGQFGIECVSLGAEAAQFLVEALFPFGLFLFEAAAESLQALFQLFPAGDLFFEDSFARGGRVLLRMLGAASELGGRALLRGQLAVQIFHVPTELGEFRLEAIATFQRFAERRFEPRLGGMGTRQLDAHIFPDALSLGVVYLQLGFGSFRFRRVVADASGQFFGALNRFGRGLLLGLQLGF